MYMDVEMVGASVSLLMVKTAPSPPCFSEVPVAASMMPHISVLKLQETSRPKAGSDGQAG